MWTLSQIIGMGMLSVLSIVDIQFRKVPVEISHADGLRAQFDDDSWVLIRPSRTSAVVRVYAEAATACERDALLSAACDLVRAGF